MHTRERILFNSKTIIANSWLRSAVKNMLQMLLSACEYLNCILYIYKFLMDINFVDFTVVLAVRKNFILKIRAYFMIHNW